MSDYAKITTFTPKDSLPTGDSEKLVLGSELDAEFDAIATAVATKANSSEVPTLAGSNTFTATQLISGTQPVLRFYESDQASNEKLWSILVDASDFVISTRTDANGAGTEAISIARDGTTPTVFTMTLEYGTFIVSGDGTTQTLALNASSAADDTSIDLKRNSTTYARVATVGTAGNVVNDSDVGDLVVRTNGGAIRLTTNSGTSTNVFVSANNALALRDGQTAPATIAGLAQIYVDTADGDLKVRFGDGTIKTIVVDT